MKKDKKSSSLLLSTIKTFMTDTQTNGHGDFMTNPVQTPEGLVGAK